MGATCGPCCPSNNSSFLHVLRRLIGETVRIQTNDSAFRGKLADVASSYVTLAERGGSCSSSVRLVFIPVRFINAVADH
jgi:hypothetical protein